MDEVFGPDNFRNEIIWHYADNFQGNVRGFATNHNNIFWYSKGKNFVSNAVMIPLSAPAKRDKRIWSRELGKLISARDESRMVKIMPVNRIATKADLSELIANLPYKDYEKRKKEAGS